MQLSDRIGRRMKLQDLHVLMTVVQAGSMGKAAQLLNTTQPNISRSISDLERSFGVRLLDRQQHGVEPTGYGRVLLDCGVAVFDDLRQGVKNMEQLADPAAGEVRIGSNPLLAGSFVSAIIDRLSRRHSRLKFRVMTGYTEPLYRDLTERNVDLLVARRFGPLTDDRLEYEFLFDDPFIVATGVHNPWARRRGIQLPDLLNESWALPPPESMIGMAMMEVFRAYGCNFPRMTVVTPSSEVRFSLLATGRFLTMIPASAVRLSTKRPDIKFLQIKLPIACAPVGLITVKNRTLGPTIRLFVECAREVARSLAKRKQ